jgi:hypothetical protein
LFVKKIHRVLTPTLERERERERSRQQKLMSQSMFTLDLIPISECWELLRNINLLLTIDNIPKKKKKTISIGILLFSLYAWNTKWVIKPIDNSNNNRYIEREKEGEKIGYIQSAMIKI